MTISINPESPQMSALSLSRYFMSPETFRARIARPLVEMFISVALLTSSPKPHANTVASWFLTSAAASMAVCIAVLPVALSIVCSPSERSSTTLVAFSRGSLSPIPSKRCRTASKPSEIEVSPSAVMSSIPSLISDSLYDHPTRLVAFAANDTTEKRDAFTPRGRNMLTSLWAKAFDPPGPSKEPRSHRATERSQSAPCIEAWRCTTAWAAATARATLEAATATATLEAATATVVAATAMAAAGVSATAGESMEAAAMGEAQEREWGRKPMTSSPRVETTRFVTRHGKQPGQWPPEAPGRACATRL
eukprot:scaffold75408_cov65-Phaeocystis_antarctica.AAC.1